MPIEKVGLEVTETSYTPTRQPKQELGKDDFLLLLTEQLKNQDPLSPMEDIEFISQMANFSSLEQMLNMNDSLGKFLDNFSGSYKSQAMMFLGTTITAQSEDMLQPVTGVVEMVGFENDVPFLKVGDYAFSIEDVQIAAPTMIEA